LLRNDVNNAMTTLRSGTVAALGTNVWHNLSLAFSGSTLTATIDMRDRGDAQRHDLGHRTGRRRHQPGGDGTVRQPQRDGGRWTAAARDRPLLGVGSGRCLDVPNVSQTNGTQVEIWDCNGGTNQQWTQLANGALQVYGTKCLNVRNQGTAAGNGCGHLGLHRRGQSAMDGQCRRHHRRRAVRTLP